MDPDWMPSPIISAKGTNIWHNGKYFSYSL
jgi:hypothetical protein